MWVGKEQGLTISCGRYTLCPASPPSPPTTLLVLSKPQRTLGEPFPIKAKGSPNNSREEEGGTTPGLGHGRVRTQACRRSSGPRSPRSTAWAPSQHGDCHALSPLAPPLCPGQSGDQKQQCTQTRQFPSAGGGAGGGGGTVGVEPDLKERTASISPAPLWTQHCTKHFHIHHPTRPHSTAEPGTRPRFTGEDTELERLRELCWYLAEPHPLVSVCL